MPSTAPDAFFTVTTIWEKISVVTMMCTFTELTVLLEQSQSGAAFALLSHMMTN